MENQITPPTNKTKLLGIILIVLLIAVGFFALFRYLKDKGLTTKNNSAEGFKVETKTLGKADKLTGFPSNLPILPGSKIIENIEYRTNDGRLQSTKKFSAPFSTQSALNKYVDFFEGLGWVKGDKNNSKSPILLSKKQDMLMKKGTNA